MNESVLLGFITTIYGAHIFGHKLSDFATLKSEMQHKDGDFGQNKVWEVLNELKTTHIYYLKRFKSHIFRCDINTILG